MILLTRLNGKQFYVNVDMVRFLEATPDTVVTLSDGSKLIVKETVEQVIERLVEYQRKVHAPEWTNKG